MSLKPIEALIVTAITQHDIDRDLESWNPMLSHIERNLTDASPKEILRRCRDLAIVMIQSSGTYGIGGTTSARIKAALETDEYEGEAREILHHQGETSIDQANRLMRARRRLRDLQLVMGGRIRDLEHESVDTRLLRIAGDADTALTVDDLAAAIARDHDEISEASCACRDVYESRPLPRLIVVPSTPREELETALRRLRRTGHAVAHHVRMLGPVKWTLTRDPESVRKSA